MRMVDLIEKKRHGRAHDEKELAYIVNGFVRGEIPDYQMSAWMMAVCFVGMTGEETAALTRLMAESGAMADLSDLPGVKVDKHSTGGVGDTTTLAVAPLVAACGGTVAKMSGRGLGHTGGTLDKLESVPGVCIEQSIESFKAIVRKTGVCVIGQSEGLVPADKLMYALRDVTGTVESIPLIASSIMSKKIAAGCDAIVLDVKCGTGGFMHTPESARALAKAMVDIGRRAGRRTVAFITDMNQPLGRAVGNGLEVKEAIELLSGKIPKDDPLYQVCMLLACAMLRLSGLALSQEEAQEKLEDALNSGKALSRLKAMLEALGAVNMDEIFTDPSLLCRTRRVMPFSLGEAGYISHIYADKIGQAAQMLGAGRATKTDVIDPAVGLVLNKRRGDKIDRDEPFAFLYVNDETRLESAVQRLREAVRVEDTPPAPLPLVYDVFGEEEA